MDICENYEINVNNLNEIKELDKICNCKKCIKYYKQIIYIDKLQTNEIIIEKIFNEYLNKLRNI